jgi:hypothetical protein
VSRSAGAVVLGALRREPPRWALGRLTDLDVVAVAEAHGVLPVLADVAVRHGVIPEPADDVIAPSRRSGLSGAGILLAARSEARARHRDLDEIRARAESALVRAGVAYRHLKGGALRDAGVWRDIATRPTRDVDILVADAAALPALEADLLAGGFVASDDVAHDPAWDDDHHGAPLVLPGRAGSLELHASALVRRHRDRLALDLPADPRDADLIVTLRHIVLHAQLQDDALLQFRLPLVALLDVAFALEAGAAPLELVSGTADPVARAAVRRHLGLAGRLRGVRFAGGRVSALRWAISSGLVGRPRAAHLVRELAFAPRALSRPVMSARVGRELRGIGLARERWRFLRARVPRGWRGGAALSTPPAAAPPHPSASPASPRGAAMTEIAAADRPVRADGFEAVWSSSGMMLVDLASDVLHHLNPPAAVVYDLVGERTVAELVSAYAVLAEVPDAEAREIVTVALECLTGIGAVLGRAPEH